jgi:hypothetical protein
MNRYFNALLFAALLMATAAAACTPGTPTPTVRPIDTPTLAPTATNTAAAKPQPTSAPTQVSTPAPTSTPTNIPTAMPTTVPTTANTDYMPYLDDRSDAAAVIHSLFNAINLHQYARAYSYWDDTPQRVTFDQFEAGYQNTASVQITLGAIGVGAGAGNLYAPVPITLNAKTTSGATQTFVGCYLLHLSQPAIQGALPFRPWGIQSATVQLVADNANAADLMSHACDNFGPPPTTLSQPTAAPGDISANQYIDSRTGPVEVLQSLYNAINRHEDVRAYSYWKSTAQNLPGLDQFEQGYNNTQEVTLTTGLVTSDAGAGQIYDTVPVALKAGLSDGTQQTFVGCYVLHISNPDIQTAPPFQPLGIESANVRQVANDADTAALMNQLCGLP